MHNLRTYPPPKLPEPLIPLLRPIVKPNIRHSNRHRIDSPTPPAPIHVQILHHLLTRISHSDNINLDILPRVLIYEIHHRSYMLLHSPISLHAVLNRIKPHNPTDARLLRECVPCLLRYCVSTFAVPDQLAAICDDDSRTIFGFDGLHEVDAAAGGERDLADGAVGEDAEVLDGLAEVED